MAFIVFMLLLLHMQSSGPIALESHVLKLPRRHVWQTFIQESIRTVSNVLDITFETNDNLTITELTHKAYSVLGENGGIRHLIGMHAQNVHKTIRPLLILSHRI